MQSCVCGCVGTLLCVRVRSHIYGGRKTSASTQRYPKVQNHGSTRTRPSCLNFAQSRREPCHTSLLSCFDFAQRFAWKGLGPGDDVNSTFEIAVWRGPFSASIKCACARLCMRACICVCMRIRTYMHLCLCSCARCVRACACVYVMCIPTDAHMQSCIERICVLKHEHT